MLNGRPWMTKSIMDIYKKKILIADDDQGIVDSLSLILEAMGYEVYSTLEGSRVIEEIKLMPDLLLIDIWMSGIDGRDICRLLKSSSATKHIPVLMISASRDNRQSALDSGANDFLGKPFEMRVIGEKIIALLA